MNDYDTFWTFAYKGNYIQGKYNKTQKREMIFFLGEEYKSLHSAKLAVTKYLNKYKNETKN